MNNYNDDPLPLCKYSINSSVANCSTRHTFAFLAPPPPPPSPLAFSYTQVMRLLLSLLSDGLPCLSDKDAFSKEDVDRKTMDKETFETLQSNSREDNLVQVFKVAVKAIGSVTECRRLGMVVHGGGVGVGSGVSDGGGGGGGGGEAVGFSELLREALSLVTGAAWSDLVPLVQKGSCDARVRYSLPFLFLLLPFFLTVFSFFSSFSFCRFFLFLVFFSFAFCIFFVFLFVCNLLGFGGESLTTYVPVYT